MSKPTVKTLVSRFHSATAKEDDAIVTRIQAVLGLTTLHNMRATDAARAIFGLSEDDKVESRHSSPVSHALTAAKVVSAFGVDPLTTDPGERRAIRQAFRVSTGRVKAQRLTEALEGVKPGNDIEAFADRLLTPAPSQSRTPRPASAKGAKPASETTANVVPTVMVPPTFPELLAAVQAMIDAAPAIDRGKLIARVEGLARKSRVALAAELSATEAAVAETAAKRAAKGTRKAA